MKESVFVRMCAIEFMFDCLCEFVYKCLCVSLYVSVYVYISLCISLYVSVSRASVSLFKSVCELVLVCECV